MIKSIRVDFARLALWIFLGLLAYMPLHIFLSTWVGSSLGFLDLAKVLKDVVLVLGFLFALVASVRKPWFAGLLKQKFIWLIAAYAGFSVVLALAHSTDQEAEVLGLVFNLRFLMFFVYGILLAHLFDLDHLRKRALQIVLPVGVAVALFGIIQYTVLPDDALTHLGFVRENGVLPAFFIDDKPDLERVMSTVRDPNSLGSYLIIIIMLLGALWFRVKSANSKQVIAGGFMLAWVCLLLTFSRSAWLGLALAALVFVVLKNKGRIKTLFKSKNIWVAGLAAVLILFGGFWLAKDTYFVQNTVFHADSSTTLEDPNELRLRFWGESVEATWQQPLGYGPGTAGLASIRNDEQGTVLNENYYLQIAHETGVIGLVLFISIVAWVLVLLIKTYNQGSNLVALALAAALVGLMFTNLLVHIWSNEAVAYTFWGLAGLYTVRLATAGKKRS